MSNHDHFRVLHYSWSAQWCVSTPQLFSMCMTRLYLSNDIFGETLKIFSTNPSPVLMSLVCWAKVGITVQICAPSYWLQRVHSWEIVFRANKAKRSRVSGLALVNFLHTASSGLGCSEGLRQYSAATRRCAESNWCTELFESAPAMIFHWERPLIGSAGSFSSSVSVSAKQSTRLSILPSPFALSRASRTASHRFCLCLLWTWWNQAWEQLQLTYAKTQNFEVPACATATNSHTCISSHTHTHVNLHRHWHTPDAWCILKDLYVAIISLSLVQWMVDLCSCQRPHSKSISPPLRKQTATVPWQTTDRIAARPPSTQLCSQPPRLGTVLRRRPWLFLGVVIDTKIWFAGTRQNIRKPWRTTLDIPGSLLIVTLRTMNYDGTRSIHACGQCLVARLKHLALHYSLRPHHPGGTQTFPHPHHHHPSTASRWGKSLSCSHCFSPWAAQHCWWLSHSPPILPNPKSLHWKNKETQPLTPSHLIYSLIHNALLNCSLTCRIQTDIIEAITCCCTFEVSLLLDICELIPRLTCEVCYKIA